MDARRAHNSSRRELLYNTCRFGISMKVVWVIKMFLNETCRKACIGKYLSDIFPIHRGLKQRSLSPLLDNFVLECTIRNIQENQV
jgi:hypothetical protein